MFGKSSLLRLLGAIALLSIAPIARADFHLWKIQEVFSDATGNVQFIQLGGVTENGENLLGGHMLQSSANSYTFPTDLPSDQTAGKSVLIATTDFAKLNGAPAPDYTIPANFFSTSGDTINYAGVDTFTFASGELPTDGTAALFADKSTANNLATNFLGASGSV